MNSFTEPGHMWSLLRESSRRVEELHSKTRTGRGSTEKIAQIEPEATALRSPAGITAALGKSGPSAT
jgi:hypothetical protein